jgi:DNA-binding beta-propeller fold protein YncE
MDRRLFLRLGAGATAAAMLPTMQGCADQSTPAQLPDVNATTGPMAADPTGATYQVVPNEHVLIIGDRRIGACGVAPGELNFPMGVVVVDDVVCVVERGNHRVQRFTTDGAMIDVVGRGDLFYPGGITAIGDEIIVADTFNHRLVGYAANGDMTRSFGDRTLLFPRGIAATADGTVIVADPPSRQVVEIRNDGMVVRSFGSAWRAPYDVATDGTYVYVADPTVREIAVFARSGGDRIATLPCAIAPAYVTIGDDGQLYVA